MLDIRKLKELIRLMVENELTEIDLKDEKRDRQSPPGRFPGPRGPGVPGLPLPPAAPSSQQHQPHLLPPARSGTHSSDPSRCSCRRALSSRHIQLGAITSPMVGTFYSAAKPESPAFANVGDTVTADTTVCIVEAMKIFNEIKAEQSGVIEKVLVSNGDSVEFGQALFLVRPA